MKNIKVIVFDFDGTLIESQKMKLQAFYDLFPKDQCAPDVITDVLKKMPEESRYVIISSVLTRITYDPAHLENEVMRLARKYDHLVVRGAKSCREIPGASELLEAAHGKHHLYLNSNTPTESLRTIVRYRGWHSYFKEIYGYPYGKEAALRNIINREKVDPKEVIVAGDGQSDQLSAENVGCNFFAVHSEDALFNLSKILGISGES